MRGFVLTGQFGVQGTLGSLCNVLNRLYGQFTLHVWDDQAVYYEAKRAHVPVVLIGYSLGANQAPEWARELAKPVDLIVCYDPSRQSPLTWNAEQHCPRNVVRALCYWNPSTYYYGGALLTGPQVEVTRINQMHLMVPFNETLHKRTIAAVEKLSKHGEV